MYKLINNYMGNILVGQTIVRDNGNGSITSFTQAPDNTDYANFKKEILADEAQLQDADGNVMDKAYVASLP